MAGNVAVQQVSETGDDVDAQRHIAAAGKAPVQYHQKSGDHQHPQDRQFVRGRHDMYQPFVLISALL